jgi:hypothetical protein
MLPVRRHDCPAFFRDTAVEVTFQVPGRKAGEILYLRRQSQLPQWKCSGGLVFCRNRTLDNERLQFGTRGVNGCGPSGRAAPNDDDFLRHDPPSFYVYNMTQLARAHP